MIKINIGCGYDKREGWINIDKAEEVKPDVVVDIEKGLPLGDNSVDEIYSHHCLEHIRPGRWKFVLAEIARVAKPGCILELDLPFDNIASRTNIDHYRTFTFSSFDQLIDDTPLRHYYSPLKLHRIEKKPLKIARIFYALFPLLKHNIHFKFSIVK